MNTNTHKRGDERDKDKKGRGGGGGGGGEKDYCTINKRLTWFSANIADLPAIEPIAFGIQVLVRIGRNSS